MFKVNSLDGKHKETLKEKLTSEHGTNDDETFEFGNVAMMLKIEDLPFDFKKPSDFAAILEHYDEVGSDDLKEDEIGKRHFI